MSVASRVFEKSEQGPAIAMAEEEAPSISAAEFPSVDISVSALSRLVGRVEEAHGQISAQFSLDNPESGLTRIVQRAPERAVQLSAEEVMTGKAPEAR